MPHDGLPVRAASGARAARADRRGDASVSDRLSLLRHALPAAAVAGATMLAFAACSGTTGGSGGVAGATGSPEASTAPSTAASVEASASAAASAGSAISVVFTPVGDSKLVGAASLVDQPDGTAQVLISVDATAAKDGMPAVLENGSCADLTAAAGASGSPAAGGSAGASGLPVASVAPSAAASVGTGASPSMGVVGSGAPSASGGVASPSASAVAGPPFMLTPLTGGTSTTIVATTTTDLQSAPNAIVLQAGPTDPTVVACADLPSSAASAAPSAGASAGASGALPSAALASPSSS